MAENLISRALLCGLGLASLTKEAIQKTADDLVNQSKISEEEGRKLVKDLQKRSAQVQKAIEKKVDDSVHKVFEHLNLPAIISDRLKGAPTADKSAGKSPTGKSAKGAKKLRGGKTKAK
jgi:polyhydroxyalkanoate synthesis regulator phasin